MAYFESTLPQQLAPLACSIAAVFSLQNVQAQAQPQAQTQLQSVAPTTLAPVVVTASERARALASDFLSVGDAPLASAPLSVTVVGSAQIDALGAKRLADLLKTDAAASDAYNAVGYWDYATLRGFVLNNKYNYRREGLPISAETSIGLENKASIDMLKGTSGIQAGTSAPGGLMNYTVKRPTQNDFRTARLELNSLANVGGAVDLGGRFGADKTFGYRINAAAEKLDNYAPNTQGNRQLLALAGDWRATLDSLFQAEIEYSHRSQPTVPALSLLGNRLPTPNPALNINSQAWSQPTVLNGLTGSLKYEHILNAQWRMTAQAGAQKLTSQDRTAFPLGCGAEGNYDRYCSDGTFDLYDYRSDNERRRTNALKLALKGQLQAGKLKHDLGFTLQSARARDQFQTQAYNSVGTSSIDAATPLPPDASLTYAPTNRQERSTEFAAYDAIAWNPAFTTWTGLRYTQLFRRSVATDGTGETRTRDHFATPWLAASLALTPSTLAYASYGQGIESELVPAMPQYSHAGLALPTLKSKQFELGFKGHAAQAQWAVTAFQIQRPAFGDAGACDGTANSCTRQLDGSARHRGLEFGAATPSASAQSPWHFDGSLSFINAARQASTIAPSLNGLRPTNVPNWIARFNVEYRVAAQPGLALLAHLSHEGARAVTQDNAIKLPAWTRLDLGLRYQSAATPNAAVWTMALDNALNKRYFNESPTQFSHIYLFSAAPRTLRLAVQAGF